MNRSHGRLIFALSILLGVVYGIGVELINLPAKGSFLFIPSLLWGFYLMMTKEEAGK